MKYLLYLLGIPLFFQGLITVLDTSTEPELKIYGAVLMMFGLLVTLYAIYRR